MEHSPVADLAHDVETAALAAIRGVAPDVERPAVPVRRGERADFQIDAAFGLASALSAPPRVIAERIVAALPLPLRDGADVSGPGFVNVRVPAESLWRRVDRFLAVDSVVAPDRVPGTVTVVDYAGPNVAKRLHVGHLRATLLGDALARLLADRGDVVIRQNHLGDWGTQFGMLVQYHAEHPESAPLPPGPGALDALEDRYRRARAAFDADPGFAERCRGRVVALQSGDRESLEVWRRIVSVSVAGFQAEFHRLGVDLTPEDVAGESGYNAVLPGLVDELVDAGVAVESRGAWCVFDDDFTDPEGTPVPLIVRKRDGGFGYAATDLAALRHRVAVLGAHRLLYVVDQRQSRHFAQVFAAARRAGWLPDDVEAVHIPFGTVFDHAGRPFKTRSGDTVPLHDLLDTAVARARQVLAERPAPPEGDLDAVAEAVGVSAVKYADLATSRTRDYRFDVDRMVSFQGDTGVYIQYAYARIAALSRRAGGVPAADCDPRGPVADAERALILHLDGYRAVLAESARRYEPHRLCGYLYGLARSFTTFYEECPVTTAEPVVRNRRLRLVEATRRVLSHGMRIIGLTRLERM
ncbi:arginyl-tRNA synthetase [Stackebrandtia albiflava]|uniref:Arginine--tRNA ligase n=1 Tax=Stackebrandtia albiflava TaxID=406432 RepID=A0A562VCJ3_9ACTN|nr:arginine--tRNA ligase [Stackebrandtia albiflava]TWJ15599.1 arginyl-tRNA synthetase [Stackebrandtia albiflava]